MTSSLPPRRKRLLPPPRAPNWVICARCGSVLEPGEAIHWRGYRLCQECTWLLLRRLLQRAAPR